jgi:signal transduction histidine kinase
LTPSSIAEESLPAALHRLAADKARQGLQVSLNIHGEGALPPDVAASLYTIVQEGLINVSKHSGVCEATVRLNLTPGHAYLEIEDRGQGFDLAAALDQPGHLGLASIFERAREIGWHLSVTARPGWGTRICLTEDASGGQL